jgi:Cdc6-like AAA superfamily ATPase
MIDDATLAAAEAIRQRADLTTSLSTEFFPTGPFRDFQTRVFTVLEEREARLRAGVMEQKGAALLGPPGTGKSCLAEKVIMNFRAVAEATGGREFGDRIVSVIVPGRASIKDTLREILRQMGYPCESTRDEDYLTQRVMAQFEGQARRGAASRRGAG